MHLKNWLRGIDRRANSRKRRYKKNRPSAQIELLQDRTMLSGVSDPGVIDNAEVMETEIPDEGEEISGTTDEMPGDYPTDQDDSTSEDDLPDEYLCEDDECARSAPQFLDGEHRGVAVPVLDITTAPRSVAALPFEEKDGDTVTITSRTSQQLFANKIKFDTSIIEVKGKPYVKVEVRRTEGSVSSAALVGQRIHL